MNAVIFTLFTSPLNKNMCFFFYVFVPQRQEGTHWTPSWKWDLQGADQYLCIASLWSVIKTNVKCFCWFFFVQMPLRGTTQLFLAPVWWCFCVFLFVLFTDKGTNRNRTLFCFTSSSTVLMTSLWMSSSGRDLLYNRSSAEMLQGRQGIQ